MSNHLLYNDKTLGQINNKHFEAKLGKVNNQIVLKKDNVKTTLINQKTTVS